MKSVNSADHAAGSLSVGGGFLQTIHTPV